MPMLCQCCTGMSIHYVALMYTFLYACPCACLTLVQRLLARWIMSGVYGPGVLALRSEHTAWVQSLCSTSQSLHSHCAVTAHSLHSHCTVTAHSLHSHCTVTAQSEYIFYHANLHACPMRQARSSRSEVTYIVMAYIVMAYIVMPHAAGPFFTVRSADLNNDGVNELLVTNNQADGTGSLFAYQRDSRPPPYGYTMYSM